MKNYFYFVALCCIISSCSDSKKDPAIKYPEKIHDSDDGDIFIPQSAMRDVSNDKTLFFEAQKEFRATHKDLDILSWNFVFSPSPYAGIYARVEKKLEPTDADQFLIDPTSSLSIRLEHLKALPKPKNGGGTFYEFNNVFIKYTLKNGWWIPEIIGDPKVDASDLEPIEI